MKDGMQRPSDRDKSQISTIFWQHLPAIRLERLQHEICVRYNKDGRHGGAASVTSFAR
jgi:hypothetical protein